MMVTPFNIEVVISALGLSNSVQVHEAMQILDFTEGRKAKFEDFHSELMKLLS